MQSAGIDALLATRTDARLELRSADLFRVHPRHWECVSVHLRIPTAPSSSKEGARHTLRGVARLNYSRNRGCASNKALALSEVFSRTAARTRLRSLMLTA